MRAGEALAEETAAMALVDHHVHGAFAHEVDRAEFEDSINEGSPEPTPEWMSAFDSQLGFAIRRWCAPVLGLPAHAAADDYWAHRRQLGTAEVTARLLRAAGVADWLVDTGYGPGQVLSPAKCGRSGATAHTIVRLETIAEEIAAEGGPGRDYPAEFRSRLTAAAAEAVGVKTILAYRAGLGIDLSAPDMTLVRDAASRWIDSAGAGRPRLTNPVLLSFGLQAASRLACRSSSTLATAIVISTWPRRTRYCCSTFCATRGRPGFRCYCCTAIPISVNPATWRRRSATCISTWGWA